MSKQCLDVQQMKHLGELGLELSNDTLLTWIVDERGKDKPLLCLAFEAVDYVDFSHHCIPAYTLQDVLDALPKYYHIAHIGWTKLSIRVHSTKEWEVGYVYTDRLNHYAYQCRKTEKNLIDAAYELFCWCVEWGFVETDKKRMRYERDTEEKDSGSGKGGQ